MTDRLLTAQSEASAESSRWSRAERVYELLLDELRSGAFSGGKRLREEEVARSLGVSRTPVREALTRLQARGLLELTTGGLTVSQFTRSKIFELYALRAVLEGSAARFAAQHASASSISLLRKLSSKFEEALDNPDSLARINRDFHRHIVETAQNRYLERALDDLHDTLALLPSTTFTVSGRPEQAAEEHRRIVDAIERGDADGAELAARVHIQNAQEARMEMLFD